MIGEVVWSASLYWLAGRSKKNSGQGNDAVGGASESLGKIDIVASQYHMSKLLILTSGFYWHEGKMKNCFPDTVCLNCIQAFNFFSQENLMQGRTIDLQAARNLTIFFGRHLCPAFSTSSSTDSLSTDPRPKPLSRSADAGGLAYSCWKP
jgi:hypothetical protein